MRSLRDTGPYFRLPPGVAVRWDGYIGYGTSSLADDSPGTVLDLLYDDVSYKSEVAKGYVPVGPI